VRLVAKFVVRRARFSDLGKVIEINRKCLPENYPEWFFRDHLVNWGEAFLVAEVDGEVVGYVMCRVELGLGVIVKGLVRRGHVISLAVLPEHRRKGIATALMKEALKVLRDKYGCKEVYLEVRVSNLPAIKLYEKLGFKRVKIIPMYYADGEDAYLMARSLENFSGFRSLTLDLRL